MSESLRKTVGKYRIDGYLGRGAMAEVYKAYHPQLERFVAIKVLHAFLADETDILDRFKREAINVAALNQSNIVRLYDFDVEGGTYFMVIEYIEGKTLKRINKEINNQGELVAIEEAIRIVKSVASALAYAHEREVIHRDVKPANVMIADGTDRVVLTDFGLARIISGPNFTRTGAMVGTPAYMSPEVAQGDSGDSRSDIYSLGVMLYQLTTGQLPFNAETPLAIIFKHINAPLPQPRSINPDIPPQLEEIITKTLLKSPDERYQTADLLLQDLEALNLNEISYVEYDRLSFTGKTGEIAVSVHVLDTGDIVSLGNKTDISFGRQDGGVFPDVDLTPFEGYRLGVSRMHSSMGIDYDGVVRLVDLGSTNGTWVNGAKISPNIPEVLSNGDIVTLGNLMLQVLIRN